MQPPPRAPTPPDRSCASYPDYGARGPSSGVDHDRDYGKDHGKGHGDDRGRGDWEPRVKVKNTRKGPVLERPRRDKGKKSSCIIQ